MSYKVTLMPGDGIGPEVCKSACEIVSSTGVLIDWEVMPLGESAIQEYGTPLPKITTDSIAKNKVALKGPTGTPVGGGFSSVNVELRKIFDLFANVRPVRSFEGVPSRYEKIDLVIVRENVEDFYTGRGRYLNKSKSEAEATGIITLRGSLRLFEYAFAYAQSHDYKKLTTVHKANIIKEMYGLFLDAGRAVQTTFPNIEYSERIVDNMAMQLVINPHQFQVIAAPNLFGDILSDLCAGLVGGLGLAPGANIGKDVAIFEAVHGTAPDIAGQNKANPGAVILSAAMMLDHLGEHDASKRITNALEEVLKDGVYVTGDINKIRPVSTTEMTEAIISKIYRSKLMNANSITV